MVHAHGVSLLAGFRIGSLLLICTFAAQAAVAQQSTLYKSVGPDGKVSYSDKPPADGRVEKTMKFDNLPSSPLPPALQAQLPRASQPPSGTNLAPAPRGAPVTLFSATWCVYCKVAKNHLRARAVAFQEFDVDTPNGRVALARAGGGNALPIMLVGSQRVNGYSEQAYDLLFSRR